ncbi:DMT family transporter [Comamonas testosteroni]|uniref:DMT family transporter n=1 Tax=Comamonas testosteroni TaxID=285 RepID=A0A373FP18_COMTE|nr:DMT family transporter [Comamonas testosteroni]RGE45893.1 DMT family transporter [Comamonas testosteroni]
MGAYLLPLGAVLIWSVNTVVSKMAAGSISAAEIGFFRWVVAAALFTPFVLPSIWRQRDSIRPLMGRITVLGVLGMVVYQSLAYYAAHYTTATHMGIIGSLTPMMVLALAVFLLGQPLTHGGVWGSLLAIAGVALVVSSGHLSRLAAEGLNLGDVMMLIAMLAYAIYNILLKRWPMPMLKTVQLLYLQILVAVVLQLPLYLFSPKTGLNASNLGLVAYAGIMASIAAPLLWMKAIQVLGPSRSSMFFNLIPVFTAIVAFFSLKEPLALYHAVGGIMTIAGLLLAELWKQPLRKPSRAVLSSSTG